MVEDLEVLLGCDRRVARRDAAPTVVWSMQSGTRSRTPDSHTRTGTHPKSPVWRMIQSSRWSTCFNTNDSPSITTRSNRASDFESVAVIGVRLDAPSTSSATDDATSRGINGFID